MCGTMMLLKLIFLFLITWKCYASSQHESGDGSGPCDNDAVMKVVEKLERRVEVVELLERRVEALEAENAEQRAEITELKAAVQQNHEHQGEASTETNDAPAAKSDDYAAGHPKTEQNRIRRASPELTIAFYAIRKSDAHHLGHGQNVPFESVVTNVGNAYDDSVGVFRAPVGGVYVFSTTVATYSRNTTHFAFALNGHPITNLRVNGAENEWDSDSQTIILDLKTGDDVSVQHTQTDKSLHGNNRSLFSGFLLSMTDEGTGSIVG